MKKKTVSRTEHIVVRLTLEERSALDSEAAKTGLSRADILRTAFRRQVGL